MPARTTKKPQGPIQEEVQAALASLEEMSTQKDRENLARFGITASKFLSISSRPVRPQIERGRPKAGRR